MRISDLQHSAPNAPAGFATATVLGLVALVAILSASALHDALFGSQLATSRLLHQRAAALADVGLGDGLARLAGLEDPSGLSYSLQPLHGSADTISVRVLHTGTTPLPAGFSLSRVGLQHFEIESTRFAARGARVTLVQGVERIMPATQAVASAT